MIILYKYHSINLNSPLNVANALIISLLSRHYTIARKHTTIVYYDNG